MSSAPQQTPEPSEETGSLEDLDGLDVEQNLFDVELTIPAAFVEEGTTQESLDAAVSEGTYGSATLNEDGSVTYTMSKALHKEMMDGIKASIDESLAAMIDPETCPTFVDITANDDYTEFTVKLNTTELGLAESFSVVAFYTFGGLYHAFNGTTVDDITVRFVNADTGDLIEESHSSEMSE